MTILEFVEGAGGIVAFLLLLILGRPLHRAYQMDPPPLALRNGEIADLLLLLYFIALLMSLVIGIHGLF